jgi:hypothetical protein
MMSVSRRLTSALGLTRSVTKLFYRGLKRKPLANIEGLSYFSTLTKSVGKTSDLHDINDLYVVSEVTRK